ncbi:MAG: DinB family protein [Ignavibacteriaceae bacterium]
MNDDILRTELINLLKTGQAFVPLKKGLSDIKFSIINTRLSPDTHSILEEIEHMKISQHDILMYMKDPDWVSPKWPDGYWIKHSSSIDNGRYQKLLDNFFSDLDKIIELINNPEVDLCSPIPHAKKHTYLREVLLVAEHNAYHYGKILDIRKTLNDW